LTTQNNALAETINGLYKTELIKPGKPWRSIEDVELATARWVDWYNHRRLYEYCGDVPPGDVHPSNWRLPTTLNVGASRRLSPQITKSPDIPGRFKRPSGLGARRGRTIEAHEKPASVLLL
jgi:Integrase core domain